MKLFKANVLVFLFLAIGILQAPAQMSEKDPIRLLFLAEADNLNCKAIQILLSTYDANIDSEDCSSAKYGESEASFNSKISYSKTRTISSDIHAKGEELAAVLTLDNFESSLNSLKEFAKNRSADISASIEIQTKKGEQFENWAANRIASSISKYDELLAAEGATNKNDDPLAEKAEVKKGTNNDKIIQPLEPNNDIDWIVWLVVILAVLSILMGFLTLLSMRKSQNEVSSLKKQLDLLNAEQSRASMQGASDVRPELDRLNSRLTEFEDILFEVKRKTEGR